MALPRIEAVITADTKQAEAGFDRVERGMEQMGRTSTRTNRQMNALNRGMGTVRAPARNLTNGFRNLGFQINDFATQVGAGTRASVALGQQLPQLLQGFGMLGIALSVVAAVGIPVARVLGDMNTEAIEMGRVFGTVAPLMSSVASAFSSVRDVAVDFAEVVINNLDRIIVTAGTVAALFAGRWVVAFVAARVATLSLVGALTALRAILIRTGIGALVIGLGEAVFQFTRLVQAAGGFGEALGMLGAVAKEVWERMGIGASALMNTLSGVAKSIAAGFLDGFALIAKAWDALVNGMAAAWNAIAGSGLGESLGLTQLDQSDVSGALSGRAGELRGEASGDFITAAGQFGELSGPMESLQAIRDLLAGMKEDRITLPDILGTRVTDEEGGGGGDKKTEAEKQIEAQTEALGILREQGRSTYAALGTFVQQFAGKSKAAAIAAIAIQKGLSIAQIIANTAAAQMRALAELGPIAGPPVAAKIGVLGKAQAALVAATGLAQAAGAGSGGAGSSGGGGAGDVGGVRAAVNTQRVDINIIGGTDRDRIVAQEVISVLNNAQRDGFRLDPRLIGGT